MFHFPRLLKLRPKTLEVYQQTPSHSAYRPGATAFLPSQSFLDLLSAMPLFPQSIPSPSSPSLTPIFCSSCPSSCHPLPQKWKNPVLEERLSYQRRRVVKLRAGLPFFPLCGLAEKKSKIASLGDRAKAKEILPRVSGLQRARHWGRQEGTEALHNPRLQLHSRQRRQGHSGKSSYRGWRCGAVG